jgi:hypothetical protein
MKAFWEQERLNEDDGVVIGTVDGSDGPVVDEGERTAVQAITEDYDGETYYYLLACLDGENLSDDARNFVRVDLDADGWRDLAFLCNTVLSKITNE